ncbi:GNAT family N-acetyltransferase [Nocardia sp. NPDC055321]
MPAVGAVRGSARRRVRLGPVLVAGQLVTLRETRLADFPRWREIRLRDREFIEPYWYTSALTWEERHTRAWWIRERLRQWRDRAAGRALPLSVLVDGEFAGQCQLAPIDPAHRCAELGLWMDARRAGHGVGTVAGALATDYAFGELGLHRVTAPVCVGNRPARQAVIRGGMSLEATMIRAVHVNGARKDHELWAVRADEAPPGGYVAALLASGVATARPDAATVSPRTRVLSGWRRLWAAAPGAVALIAARYLLGAPWRARERAAENALPHSLSGLDSTNRPVLLRQPRSRPMPRADRRRAYEVCAAGEPIGRLHLDLTGPNIGLTLDFDSGTPRPGATAAVTLLLDHAIDQLRGERVETLIDPAATHLSAIAGACGLRREGVLIAARRDRDGSFRDVELWAATREKPSRTTAYE